MRWRGTPSGSPLTQRSGGTGGDLPCSLETDGGGEAVTEAEWLACTETVEMLGFLRGKECVASAWRDQTRAKPADRGQERQRRRVESPSWSCGRRIPSHGKGSRIAPAPGASWKRA
jgi:hypothetical protein